MSTPQHSLAWHRGSGVALAVGAGVLATVTWLERFFGPLVEADPQATLVTPGAVPIHLVSFVAFVLVVVGLPAVATVQPQAGRAARVGALAVTFGFWLGVVPHTVLDFSAIPVVFDALPHDQAAALTDRMYATVGPLAMVGIVALLPGLIVLSLVSRRAGVLPRWAWLSGLVAIPAAVGLGVLSGLLPQAPIPHPPVALDLALVAYGLGVRRAATESQPASSAAPALART